MINGVLSLIYALGSGVSPHLLIDFFCVDLVVIALSFLVLLGYFLAFCRDVFDRMRLRGRVRRELRNAEKGSLDADPKAYRKLISDLAAQHIRENH